MMRTVAAIKRLPSRVWQDVRDLLSQQNSEPASKKAAKKVQDKEPDKPKITDRRKAVDADIDESSASSDSESAQKTPSSLGKLGALLSFKPRTSEPVKERESGPFVMGDNVVKHPTSELVHDVDAAGVQFDDPVDAAAFLASLTRRVSRPSRPNRQRFSSSLRTIQMVPRQVSAKTGVNRRRNKEAPPEEQIEIPLPEDLKVEGYKLPPLHFLDYDDSDQIEVDPIFLRSRLKGS